MAIQFEIESIFKPQSSDKFYVFARQINTNRDWQLTNESKFGEIEIEKWFDIPRAHDKNGNIRLDLFVFTLKNKDDATTLSINQIVELIS